MASLTSIAINLVIFGMIMIPMAYVYGNAQIAYNPANSTAESEFYKFNESVTDLNALMDETKNHTVGAATKSITDLSKYNDIMLVMFDVGGIILKIPAILINFIEQLATLFPYVPGWLIQGAITIVVIIFVLRIASLFMKTEEL